MLAFWSAIITVIIASVVGPLATRIWDWAVGKKDRYDKDMNMRMRRLEIQMNISHNPEDAETILNLFDEYRKEGGNSYIQDRVQQWHDKYKHEHSPRRGKKNGR